MSADTEGQERPEVNTKYVCLLRCKQGSAAHCPLRDQVDPGKGVADVTQEGILLRKYYAIEAPCTEAPHVCQT